MSNKYIQKSESWNEKTVASKSGHGCHDSDANKKPSYPVGWRHVVAMGVFTGYFLMYALRVNLSVGLVAMLNHTGLANESDSKSNTTKIISICRRDNIQEDLVNIFNETRTIQKKNDGPFLWSSQTQGILLGSFFYGYILTQFAGGVLAGKYGSKWVFGLGNVITAILTMLSPMAAYMGVEMLIVLRIMEGFSSGVMLPAAQALFSRWAPPSERSTLMAVSHAGPFLGTPVTFAISGLLVDANFLGGWPSLFYVFGIAGCVWFFFWYLFCSSDPKSHRFISNEEKMYIVESLEATNAGNKKPGLKDVPWKPALKSKAVWSIYISHVAYTWGLYVTVTCLPTYFKRVQGFDIGKNGLLSALPYLCQSAIHLSSGKLADYLQNKFSIKTVTIRKFFDCSGHILPGIFIICVGFVGCNGTAAVAIFTLAVGFTGLCGAGFFVSFLDIAPQFSSMLFGISNTFATIPGIVGPYLTSYLTKENTMGGWRTVFFIIGVLYLISALFFAIFAQATVQPWAQTKQVVSSKEKEASTSI